jgi:hypothetical protein
MYMVFSKAYAEHGMHMIVSLGDMLALVIQAIAPLLARVLLPTVTKVDDVQRGHLRSTG